MGENPKHLFIITIIYDFNCIYVYVRICVGTHACDFAEAHGECRVPLELELQA